MIIPTSDYDPMFADDGVPFRTKMIRYIQREFSDTLGSRVGLLESDDGLDALARIYRLMPVDKRHDTNAA